MRTEPCPCHGRSRGRSRGHLRAWRLVTLALALRSVDAGGAAFSPDVREPDPPTGDVHAVEAPPASPDPAPAGPGIRWTLAPWRHAGTVSLEGRWLRLEDGSTSSQALVFNEVDFASYVWQPWFIQLRAGVGALVARSHAQPVGDAASDSTATGLTGRFSMLVFPASRFPFELRADVSDSRTRGDFLGTDYRSHRLTLHQSYRPETGNDSYSATFDWSRLAMADGREDRVSSLRATALRQFEHHTLEFSGNLTHGDQGDDGAASRFTSLAARHGFQPAPALQVDTMATWNEVRLQPGATAPGVPDLTTDIRQLTSFATWRPREGDWLYSADAPLYLTGSVRWVDAGSKVGDVAQRAQSLNASLGVSKEFSREWRASLSGSATQVEPDDGTPLRSLTGHALLAWTPAPLPWGDWRYAPSAGASASATRTTNIALRHTLGAQLGHGLSRHVDLGEGQYLTLNVNQSVASLRESESGAATRSLAHSAGVFWQGGNGGPTQSFAGLSLSDSRTRGDFESAFQLVNLQLSRRTQWSRSASWSGHLTLQATRSDAPFIDATTGLVVVLPAGWQRYYSGSVHVENSRLFGVPRLRWTLLVSADSQQFERRALGDLDAPRERITESIENRLDYAIGRLETRLAARVARIDGRTVGTVYARVQRRY